MPTNTISIGTAGGANLISKSIVIAAEQSQSYEFTVADQATNFPVAMTLDVSLLKAIYIVSDQNILLDTNVATPNPGVDGDVLNLLANEPYVWWSTALHTNILTLDITNSFWTNLSGAVANVKIELVVDPTA